VIKLALAALLAALASPGSVALAQQKTAVLLGTATPGGGFARYAAPLVEILNDVEPSLAIEPRSTKGSTDTIPLLEAGKLDIGLVAGEPAYQAFEGIGRPRAQLTIIGAMYSMAGMFVVRAETPYRTISDLKSKPIAFGARSSGLVVLARNVLDGMGLDAEKDFQAVFLDRAGDGTAMILDGRVVALWGGGIGWPGFANVAKSPGGARFIAPDAGERKRILARQTQLQEITVPAGSMPGQDATITSVGSWSYILARPALADEVAYRLARALHRGHDTLAKRLTEARETTPQNTVAAAPRPDLIHPGAQRYLREIAALR
jgi:TRAP transporter TAXI family solute receptor